MRKHPRTLPGIQQGPELRLCASKYSTSSPITQNHQLLRKPRDAATQQRAKALKRSLITTRSLGFKTRRESIPATRCSDLQRFLKYT
jgi:hypothetical protein